MPKRNTASRNKTKLGPKGLQKHRRLDIHRTIIDSIHDKLLTQARILHRQWQQLLDDYESGRISETAFEIQRHLINRKTRKLQALNYVKLAHREHRDLLDAQIQNALQRR